MCCISRLYQHKGRQIATPPRRQGAARVYIFTSTIKSSCLLHAGHRSQSSGLRVPWAIPGPDPAAGSNHFRLDRFFNFVSQSRLIAHARPETQNQVSRIVQSHKQLALSHPQTKYASSHWVRRSASPDTRMFMAWISRDARGC